MREPQAPYRLEALPAYALSALTALLWVACVLPAGTAIGVSSGGVSSGGDAATPIHREAILLVPALLVLIAVPTGCAISRRRRGMRAVLASMDAFVAVYAAIALWSEGVVFEGARVADLPLFIGSLLLLMVGGLSVFEVRRCTRSAPPEPMPRMLAGLRLAICLLVLTLPLTVLVRPDVERASLLAPFFFVAVSAGGARLARDMQGLRRTAALLQLVLTAHVLVTLRYTIYRSEPHIVDVNVAGRVVMGLAVATAAIALLQLLVLVRPGATADVADPSDPAQVGAGA